LKKPKLNNPLQMARPKTGRQTFPHSIALTMEQIQFLHETPNASELVRSVLDSFIKNKEDLKNKFPIIALQQQINDLEQQRSKIWNERSEYAIKHDKERFQDGLVDQPLDTPEAKYHQKVLDNYDDVYLDLNSQINKLKERINNLC
jgi:hypothetical protein